MIVDGLECWVDGYRSMSWEGCVGGVSVERANGRRSCQIISHGRIFLVHAMVTRPTLDLTIGISIEVCA